eukprot:CAMPEP_0194205034 /NCGR_PEP_ID=MMETSP0156-20130528/4388_1 /TAXON_ID=33649 /ORGANISM="Thalassionema nitzschioides, Strain L26-B" /LENGTH=227 /DNA_ID=CAMNT_0038931187 /DNA_START=118 /DNA_END=801 /DNA_ORIENTATION=+
MNALTSSILLLSATYIQSFTPAASSNIVGNPQQRTSTTSTTALDATTVGLYFGTVGGNTKTVANHIKAAADADATVTFCEIEDLSSVDAFTQHDALIIGAPTWNTGAEKQRTLTGWDQWLYDVLPGLASEMKGKKVAFFGVGDQGDYPFNYCDSVGELHSEFERVGCDVKYGRTSTEGYYHVSSKAQVDEEEPVFYGLCCDENQQPDQSEDRCIKWIAQLKSEEFFA